LELDDELRKELDDDDDLRRGSDILRLSSI
jgi:hypothetical protein